MRRGIQSDACECGGDSRVSETRPRGDGAIRRARKCMRCGKRWATFEVRGKPGCVIVAVPVGTLAEMRRQIADLLASLKVATEITEEADVPKSRRAIENAEPEGVEA